MIQLNVILDFELLVFYDIMNTHNTPVSKRCKYQTNRISLPKALENRFQPQPPNWHLSHSSLLLTTTACF